MPIKPYKQASTGRVTTPRGTFLSNPSTASDGFLGGPLGTNPAVASNPYSVPSYVGLTPTTQLSPAKNLFTTIPGTARNTMLSLGQVAPVSANTNGGKEVLFNNAGQPLSGSAFPSTRPDTAWDVAGNRYSLDQNTGQYKRDTTNAFTNNSTNGLNASVLGKAPQPFSNNLVGLTLGADTKQLEMKTAMQIFPGLSGSSLNESMSKIGYSFVQGPRGGSYVYTGEGADPNFKPINATQSNAVGSMGLAQGERQKLENGATIIGGQDYKGQQQYTYVPKMKKGQNYNVVVEQDSSGAWRRRVVPVYDGGNYRKNNNRKTTTKASSNQPSTLDATSQQQLVNLRVNYG